MKRIRKLTLLIILPLWLGTLSLESWASFLTSGKPAPNFLVESGDNQKLSLDMVRGKVVVLFYESRRAIKENSSLKDELTRFYRTQPAHIQKNVFRLVVIDCTTSTWPTVPIWKSKLRENSGKEGFTIYGDWTGNMSSSYRMQAGKSNFLIIDKHGIIRYTATGRIDSGQFEQIKRLLLNLVQAG
jgi:alkyl hydroperoxide reductase subunit AhpC